MTPKVLKPAVFLDRDGILIDDVHHLQRKEDIRPTFKVTECLQQLKRDGYTLIVVTNQSCVGRKLLTRDEMWDLHLEALSQIDSDNLITCSYACIHRPEDSCDCRKPEPGMLLAAARRWGLDMALSWMVGDRDTDVQAGLNAGIPRAQCFKTNSLADLLGLA